MSIKNRALTLGIILLTSGCIKLTKQNSGEGEIQTSPTQAKVGGDILFSGTVDLTKESGLREHSWELRHEGDSDVYWLRATRIHFETGSLLKIGSKKIHFVADELTVDQGATIETFAKTDQAAANELGQDGGVITIESSRAHGTLALILNGESGGDGAVGPAPTEALRGSRGHDGRDGIVTDCHDCLQPELCSLPTQGSFGGNGLPGFTGFPGKNGGDTGAAQIEIKSRDGFAVQVIEQIPGSGGHGGPGGAGGEPGLPGTDGTLQFVTGPWTQQRVNAYLQICPMVKFNRTEPQAGPPGPVGADGAPGKLINLL